MHIRSSMTCNILISLYCPLQPRTNKTNLLQTQKRYPTSDWSRTLQVIEGGYFYRPQFQNERMHRKCCPYLKDEGTYFATFHEHFESEQKAVESIVDCDYKGFWYCCHCDRPLFVNRYTCSSIWH
jgi:hypothetical protein